MQLPGLKDLERSGKTSSGQPKSLDSTAGGDAEFRLDAAVAHTVEAVMEVGDDAGVVGEDADTIADAEAIAGFDARNAVFFSEADETGLTAEDQAVAVGMRA
jgi:hypothetical protein